MSDLPDTPIGIREATESDAPQVVSMLCALHEQNEGIGGLVKKGPRTERWVASTVDAALAGRGLCLVAHRGEPAGALLAVDSDAPYDNDFGRMIVGLGTYVRPAHRRLGIARLLYETAQYILRHRGYDTYFGARLPGNDSVAPLLDEIGFVPAELSVIARMR